MKAVLLSIGTVILLAGCASTPTSYGPAENNGLGYSHYQIQKDRFRVSFTGKTPEEAERYVLRRAAELTLNHQYDHFKVVGGNAYGNAHGGSPFSTNAGVGIGSGGRLGTRTNVGLGVGVHDVAQALSGDKVTASLEIIAQTGGGTDPNIYDANAIVNSIKPPVYTP